MGFMCDEFTKKPIQELEELKKKFKFPLFKSVKVNGEGADRFWAFLKS